ncbi:hypothetical protein [Sphingobacterium faecium]|nr:hypothetical protein [Sphingobacterium faecium]
MITKSHVPILEFAFLKMVYATSVYSAIEKGKIKPDYLDLPNGERLPFIDLRKYGNYKFRVHNPNKTALIKWYISVDYIIKTEKLKRKLMGRYGFSRQDLVKQPHQKKTKGHKSQVFTEWCYNRIVEHSRSYQYYEADIFKEILQKHLDCNLVGQRLKEQRTQAGILLDRISDAIACCNYHKLTYFGEENAPIKTKKMKTYFLKAIKKDLPDLKVTIKDLIPIPHIRIYSFVELSKFLIHTNYTPDWKNPMEDEYDKFYRAKKNQNINFFRVKGTDLIVMPGTFLYTTTLTEQDIKALDNYNTL